VNSDTIIIGTRASKLALWQAEYVAAALENHHPNCRIELKKMTTKGDRILDAPLAKIGGKGLFTKELEQAMLAGDIDIAVHSLKDMPVEVPEGLMIGAITERLDPGDAFVSQRYESLEALPQGARVGTSSLRRRAKHRAREGFEPQTRGKRAQSRPSSVKRIYSYSFKMKCTNKRVRHDTLVRRSFMRK